MYIPIPLALVLCWWTLGLIVLGVLCIVSPQPPDQQLQVEGTLMFGGRHNAEFWRKRRERKANRG